MTMLYRHNNSNTKCMNNQNVCFMMMTHTNIYILYSVAKIYKLEICFITYKMKILLWNCCFFFKTINNFLPFASHHFWFVIIFLSSNFVKVD